MPAASPHCWSLTEDADMLNYVGASSWEGEQAARPILAERYKTKFCRNYMETGMCLYGWRCMFAHGAHELRTPEMNFHDGLVTEEAIRAFRRRRAAPAYFYAAPRNGALRHRMRKAAPATQYTHNPYACDLLPLQNRLYSQAPALGTLPGTTEPLCCCGYGHTCCSYLDSIENQDGCASYVEITQSPDCYAFRNDDAELSACSSIGSDSEDNRQPTTPYKAHSKEQPPMEDVENGTEAP
ncbi:Zinc finger protein CTH1 [Trypanosoma rangeli]|uniref:Zinc finger protein CTH1 n=1 Tax=Trypanosoma rangeli TaxID=5698 RepID=A0A3R7RDV1_TRYRA|nr:Zinc finger protein CTH1 [Trypanosoma rangeli]RNF00626.1 Zinc finger protein CTH1 [Trypanosoma rangeli]|eukprot:RNF00626.1 Zinc finger protein CTH1 [Trypanosoma rangeli]